MIPDVNGKIIELETAGVGIIFYSPRSAQHIPEGEDYLTSNYTTEEQVQSHIQQGTIVGFGTGTSGTFLLRFHSGYPDAEFLKGCDFKLRLGLRCCDRTVCFRDLYDLMDWHSDCPDGQILELEDGFYHVTLCSNRPRSGYLGDRQEIHVYIQSLRSFPALDKEGIPTLCM